MDRIPSLPPALAKEKEKYLRALDRAEKLNQQPTHFVNRSHWKWRFTLLLPAEQRAALGFTTLCDTFTTYDAVSAVVLNDT